MLDSDGNGINGMDFGGVYWYHYSHIYPNANFNPLSIPTSRPDLSTFHSFPKSLDLGMSQGSFSKRVCRIRKVCS